MIHTLLVPLDGSRLAEQALPEARRIARAADATIVLLRVVRGSSASQEKDHLSAHLSLVAAAEEYLRLKARELTSAGFSVRTDVFCNDPADAIGVAAMVHGANLIVMSTHGRTGVRRAVLGSVAEKVVREATLPVLLVRGGQPVAPSGPYRKILVPLDGSALAESALRYVAGAEFAREATLVLLDSVPAPVAPVAGGLMGSIPVTVYEQVERETEHQRSTANRYLYGVALAYLDERPWESYVAEGKPAAQIVEAARASGADLIVMATHGRTGVDLLLHGSVAAQVLRHAAVPVLLLHQGTEANAAHDAEQGRTQQAGDAHVAVAG